MPTIFYFLIPIIGFCLLLLIYFVAKALNTKLNQELAEMNKQKEEIRIETLALAAQKNATISEKAINEVYSKAFDELKKAINEVLKQQLAEQEKMRFELKMSKWIFQENQMKHLKVYSEKENNYNLAPVINLKTESPNIMSYTN